MKPFILFLAGFICVQSVATAQHIRIRLDFPVGASVRPGGNGPFRGAVWIGPEWRWQRGQYVYVPGYWAKPKRRGAIWTPGYWNNTRRGYVWIPGRWR
ncbi:MAG: hypothetical protein ACK5G0_00640 [Bacteroidota bacterium]